MARVLSVIVPVFNEARCIDVSLRNIVEQKSTDWQVILCDDASTDGFIDKIDSLCVSDIDVFIRQANGGKTAAVRDGLRLAKGKWVVVQDADLEYDPADLHRLLAVGQEKGRAVYGKRPSYWHWPSRWPFALGVLLVDVWLFVVYRRWVRDHATCYKMMPTELMRSLDLQSNGFEGCVEITAKLMRLGIPIHQVPISYHPRSAKDGKKLTWRYGWTALQAVWHWRNWTMPAKAKEVDREIGETANKANVQ